MRSACSSPVPKITYTPARDITMPIAFFHVILSFKNIASLPESSNTASALSELFYDILLTLKYHTDRSELFHTGKKKLLPAP